MQDLISRQAAIEELGHAAWGVEWDKALAKAMLESLPTAQPEPHYDEWCADCKEYDKERHCCPRWNRVIRQALNDAHIKPQWIPCGERLPKVGRTVICQCRADILKLLKLDSGGDWYQDAEHVYMSGFVIAWMPLPEPYKEEK